jgi:hypothetical protein
MEGIGDILIYETRRQKNKLVLDGLKKISDILKRLFEIQKKDPEKFNALILSQELLDLYKEDEKEANYRLSFEPEKHLISFSTAINQITRTYDAAVQSQNEEISRFAIYHIYWILETLASLPDNALFIEQILRKLSQIIRTAVQHNNESAYAAAIECYIGIVFNRYQANGNVFQLSYLNIFDRYFLSSVQYIVSQDQFSFFKNIVTSLIVGIHVPTYNQGKVWDYESLLVLNDWSEFNRLNESYHLNERIAELAESDKDIDTQKKLNQWLDKFDELNNLIEPAFKQTKVEEAKKLQKEIRDYAESMLKYNNLLEIIFGIGAYCLFKRKPAFIRYLWEYKQPPDSEAIWAGHDIVPNTLDEVIAFYFKKGIFERRPIFWEDHHGSEKYYKQYFLLLLARALQNIRADAEGKYPTLDNYQLRDFNIHRLSNIEYSVAGYIELAVSLKTGTDILSELGFNIAEMDELINRKLVPFLMRLRDESVKQISTKHKNQLISPTKINEFKDQVVEHFYNSAILRDILVNHFKIYENKIIADEEDETENRFGIFTVDDKAAFFDEWHIGYAQWGVHYGEDMGQLETMDLFNQISNHCIQISSSELEGALKKFENPKEIVILASANPGFWFFKDSQNFKPKWQKGISQIEIKGFAGWYDIEGETIPVFDIGLPANKQMLILDRSRMGKLIQLSPLNKGENKILLRDIFYINIRAFSDDQNLINEYIEKSIEWLKKVGNEERQREYLQERALIEIFERFEYNQTQDKIGYKIQIKK